MRRIILSICAFLTVASIAVGQKADSVYAERIKASQLDGTYIPKDLYDCFRQLDKLMDNKVREKFMSFSDEEVDARTHLSLGKWLEFQWSLRQGSRLSNYFSKMGVPHPDYMVSMVITAYHRYLHKKDLDLKSLMDFYKENWETRKKKEREKMKSLYKE